MLARPQAQSHKHNIAVAITLVFASVLGRLNAKRVE
jgi:hypothetical protein